MARDDPFAGIRLSEQAVAGRLDQRLFTSEPSSPPPSKPRPTSQPDGLRVPAEAVPRAAGPKERTAPKVSTSSAKPRFDLAEQPFYKASFLFTQEELEALEDLKLEMRRQYDVKATKNGLIRCALHMLLEDHAANGGHSYASRRIRRLDK